MRASCNIRHLQRAPLRLDHMELQIVYSLLFAGPQATYTQGSIITVKANLTANHAGRFRLSLCPLSRGQVTQACFDNPTNFLVRADGPYAGKRYLYLTGGDVTDGKMSVVSKWRLPSSVNCPDGCMVQWWWLGFQVGVARPEMWLFVRYFSAFL
jgi:hypothetical protein